MLKSSKSSESIIASALHHILTEIWDLIHRLRRLRFHSLAIVFLSPCGSIPRIQDPAHEDCTKNFPLQEQQLESASAAPDWNKGRFESSRTGGERAGWCFGRTALILSSQTAFRLAQEAKVEAGLA